MKAPTAKKALPYAHGFLTTLHPNGDDRVTLHRKVGETGFQNIGSVRIGDIGYWLPDLWRLLTEDSYVSNHALHPAKGENKKFPGCKVGVRHQGLLHKLSACWVDIDCHHCGIDPLFLKQCIERQVELRKLPPPTIYHFSGKGLWVFWALREDPFSIDSPKATPQNRLSWNQIQSEIESFFRWEGSDPASSKDILRMARIPGSVNTSAEKVVTYQVQFNEEGEPFRYTFEELADGFDLQLKGSWEYQPVIVGDVSQNQKGDYQAPARKNGWVALNETRLQDIQVLLDKRKGGFTKGMRERGALVLKSVLLKNNYPRERVRSYLIDYARKCSPPFSLAEVDAVMDQKKLFRFRDVTLAEWFDITPKEASFLIRLPAAAKYDPSRRSLPPPKARKAKVGIFGLRENRRQAIKDIVRELGRVPPVREMASMLKERGAEGNKDSVSKDYVFLKLETTRQERKRKRKELAIENYPKLPLFDDPNSGQGVKF